MLYQLDPGFPAGFALDLRPDARLNLSDVGFLQEEHAQTGLPDTSAYAKR